MGLGSAVLFVGGGVCSCERGVLLGYLALLAKLRQVLGFPHRRLQLQVTFHTWLAP